MGRMLCCHMLTFQEILVLEFAMSRVVHSFMEVILPKKE
jgi:hypothetical protein